MTIKTVVKILRITAHISTMPAMAFFFYFAIQAVKPGSKEAAVAYILPVAVLLIPVVIHFIAHYLNKFLVKPVQ